MNRRVLITACVAAALLSAGCSRAVQPPATLPPVTTPAAARVAVTAAGAEALPSQDPALAADLLTTHDLPAGWTSLALSSNTAHSAACGSLSIGDSSDRPLPREAFTEFTDRATASTLGEMIQSGDAAPVAQVWSGLGNLASVCPTFKVTSASTAVAYQLANLTLPTYGSRAHAFTLTAMGNGIMLSGDLVAVRKDDLIVVIMTLGVQGVPSSVLLSALGEAVARA
ncbi:hypothetical protein [Actinospica robiniae]|uniref:hypothetical protein n=1 Tax=Actinospica robiniae TaxID=304901 RepID=UPI0004141FC1|nr:hypothetical protein [Actinospica robiniae]